MQGHANGIVGCKVRGHANGTVLYMAGAGPGHEIKFILCEHGEEDLHDAERLHKLLNNYYYITLLYSCFRFRVWP